jgi:REP element-mobilizing transposase RayT
VGAWELYKFGGDATKTDARRSLARDSHDVQLRQQAKQFLKYPPVRFDEGQRGCIAAGVAKACAESAIELFALAIGYDHVHAVVGRHGKTIEKIVGQFKGRATQKMREAGCHPLQRFANGDAAPPTPWAEKCWTVYINDEVQLGNAIEYVERHPGKEGLPPQHWPFVKARS